MKRSRDDRGTPFDGLAAPEPPGGLRERVLPAARATLAASTAADPWEELWRSRSLRWAWSCAVAALLAGHWAASRPSLPDAGAANRRSAFGRIDLETAAELTAPRIDLGARGLSWIDRGGSDRSRSGPVRRVEGASAS